MSLLAVQPDGKTVEVGLIGREGFAGLPLVVGYHSSPTRVVTQGDGEAYRCSAQDLRKLIRECPELAEQLHRFAHKLAMHTTQIAACNRLHEVEERLARWILMSQDRILSDNLPLTQEFLAQMLGTTTLECHGLCWHSAKGRIDFSYARKRHNFGQAKARSGGV